jgi:hypothetical protein
VGSPKAVCKTTDGEDGGEFEGTVGMGECAAAGEREGLRSEGDRRREWMARKVVEQLREWSLLKAG